MRFLPILGFIFSIVGFVYNKSQDSTNTAIDSSLLSISICFYVLYKFTLAMLVKNLYEKIIKKGIPFYKFLISYNYQKELFEKTNGSYNLCHPYGVLVWLIVFETNQF